MNNNYIVTTLVFIVFSLALAGEICCQDSKPITKIHGTSMDIYTITLIPEASSSCTPVECEWWNRLRLAGNDLQRKGDEKSKRGFALALAEGLEKSYRVPVDDRPPLGLSRPSPAQLPPGIRHRNGKVELEMEV